MSNNGKIIDFNKRKQEMLKSKEAVEKAKIYGEILKRIVHLLPKKPIEEKE